MPESTFSKDGETIPADFSEGDFIHLLEMVGNREEGITEYRLQIEPRPGYFDDEAQAETFTCVWQGSELDYGVAEDAVQCPGTREACYGDVTNISGPGSTSINGGF